MPERSITYRPATPFDAPRIAALHARSWQENYRGDMTDHYLDREAAKERLAVWTDRFSSYDPNLRVMLAEEENDLVAFCCLLLHDDPDDGTLLDNLHVRKDLQGTGVGRRLIRWAAVTTLAEDPTGKFYLWVLRNNVRAAAMYRHIGGRMGRTEYKHLVPGQPDGVAAVCVHFLAEELV